MTDEKLYSSVLGSDWEKLECLFPVRKQTNRQNIKLLEVNIYISKYMPGAKLRKLPNLPKGKPPTESQVAYIPVVAII